MIETYDPHTAPDPDEWLQLDEITRITLILDYHETYDTYYGEDIRMHSFIQQVVENQAAQGDDMPVRDALKRLQNEGLDRHQALHAVGAILTKYLHELQQTNTNFNNENYNKEIRRLTKQKWHDMFEDE